MSSDDDIATALTFGCIGCVVILVGFGIFFCVWLWKVTT